MAFVRVSGLRKAFGTLRAVDGVSFAVAAGATLALLGPSGCGKTTVLRCLAGLENGEDGVIEIAGRTVFDPGAGVNLKPEARDLGVVFQSYAVWPHMTVAENVGFPLKVRRRRAGEIAERTARILALVGLDGAGDQPAAALSGGQQQRVALARALVHEPSLVLFDEPMSNLDARLRARMRMELALLQERLDFTAIYVTHDQAEAFALAQTVVVMNNGRIETAAPPREVFARPQTPFVAEFLGFNVNRGEAVTVVPQGADDPGFHVEAALGAVRIWGVQRGDAPVRPGDAVLVCTRKEDLAVEPGRGMQDRARGAGGVPADQTFTGVIEAASYLGLEEEYVIAVDGIRLGAIQRARGLGAGEPVAVTIRCADVLVFAAADGGR